MPYSIKAGSRIGDPPHHPKVTLRTPCWACGEILEKLVPARRRAHRHFSWRCEECDVAWSGPGEVA